MTNSPLVNITFKKILFIMSTSTVCMGSSSLDRLADAMLCCPDEKAAIEIGSGFNFQGFKKSKDEIMPDNVPRSS